MLPTPFHPRTSALNQSHDWRSWSGYLAASTYELNHEREYYAIRQAAALIDVSPLFKYEISGPDALRLVNRIMTRDIARCRVGQVMYSPWCDEEGKIIDDGTVARLAPDRFRITSADPNLRWFRDCGYGMEAEVVDVSQALAALALQGPHARRILMAVLSHGNPSLDHLGYYHLAQGELGGIPLTVTRTGYTGDLGYELWVAPDHALALWDALTAAGQGNSLVPAGMVALDIARIEAGLLLVEIDYISAARALIESQKSSPFEVGLGWAVALGKDDFIGRRALRAEKEKGSPWAFVGLHVHWTDLEALFGAVDLPPKVAGRASRASLPIYRHGRQVGQATSSTFSPLLKRSLAIGTVETAHAHLGTLLEIEVTVEYRRQRARATVVPTPFYNPPWKRA